MNGMAMAWRYKPRPQTTAGHILTLRSVMSHLLFPQPQFPLIKWQIKVRMKGVSCRQPAEIVCYTLVTYFQETLNLLRVLKIGRVHIQTCAFGLFQKAGGLGNNLCILKWQQVDSADQQLPHYCMLLGHRLAFQFATVPTTPYQCHLAPVTHSYVFCLCYSLKSLYCKNSST